MAMHSIDFVIITAFIPGLILLIFPKQMHKYMTLGKKAPYTKKEELKCRSAGTVLILISIVLLIYEIRS